jgi:hypothetical protein
MLDPDPPWNQCGSETLRINFVFFSQKPVFCSTVNVVSLWSPKTRPGSGINGWIWIRTVAMPLIQDQKCELGQGEGGGNRAEEEGGAEAEAHGEGESVQTGEETEEENGGQVPVISHIFYVFGCFLKNFDPSQTEFFHINVAFIIF